MAVIGRGEGELVGDSPDRRVEILAEHDALHATWSRFGPGREGADLHVHHRHTDLFYVVDGELTLRLGPEGAAVAMPAGTLARIPPLVVHGFRNASAADVRYLNLHAPGMGFADFLRALRDGRRAVYDQHDPPAGGGRPPSEAVIGGDPVRADGAALLADVEEIAIAEVTAEPGEPAPSPRVDPGHVASLYVLEGEVALADGDREHRAAAGAWVQVPPGVEHSVTCRGREPARFLRLHTPGAGSFV